MSDARRLLPCIALCASLVLADAARALCEEEPLPDACKSFSFVAEVGLVQDPNGILGPLGATIAGTLTLDASTPDLDPSPDRGVYVRAVECATIDLGDTELWLRAVSTDPEPPNGIFVRNDLDEGGGVQRDELRIGIDQTDAARLGPDAGAAGFEMILGGVCADPVFPCPPAALASDAIPVPPPPPSAFAPGAVALQVAVQTLAGFATLQADPTDLRLTAPIACPEPARAASGAALAALSWLAAARRASRASG